MSKSMPWVLDPGRLPAVEGKRPFAGRAAAGIFPPQLNSWKEEILKESRETIQNLQAETVPHADLADRASTEAERQLELRTRDRQRKLIAKIDAALRRIEDGSYGFCEETGEPISLKRLDARPIATLSIEAQERHERREKVPRQRALGRPFSQPGSPISLWLMPACFSNVALLP